MISFIKIEHCTHGDMLSAFGEKHFINIELLEKNNQIMIIIVFTKKIMLMAAAVR